MGGWKKRLLIFVVIAVCMGIVVYGYSPAHSVKPFFSLLLSDPKAPINELFRVHYALRSLVARTPVALDAKGRIYITGIRDGKARIIVLDQRGQIERIIIPRFKDGRFLRWCSRFSVSPSGNHIWTVEWEKAISVKIKTLVHRVTVHDSDGRGREDWLVKGYPSVFWLLNAYSEDSAYAMVADGDVTCLHFTMGRDRPKKFKTPKDIQSAIPFFYHSGRYWWIKESKKSWLGVMTWTPGGGVRLVSKFEPGSRCYRIIDWIDERGNFYGYRRGRYSVRLPSFLRKIPFLVRIFKAFGIPEYALKPFPPEILICSPDGKLLDVVPLYAIIRPRKGEKLEYGQLVKVDETGIYLEVERVSEPREYRIVRIVKKPRWKVWWERLTKRN